MWDKEIWPSKASTPTQRNALIKERFFSTSKPVSQYKRLTHYKARRETLDDTEGCKSASLKQANTHWKSGWLSHQRRLIFHSLTVHSGNPETYWQVHRSGSIRYSCLPWLPPIQDFSCEPNACSCRHPNNLTAAEQDKNSDVSWKKQLRCSLATTPPCHGNGYHWWRAMRKATCAIGLAKQNVHVCGQQQNRISPVLRHFPLTLQDKEQQVQAGSAKVIQTIRNY